MSPARRAAAAESHNVYELQLATGTPAQAFERLAVALDEGRVSIGEAKLLSDIIAKRLVILDAEKFRRRIELAEATARAAIARTALPASRATVDTSTVVATTPGVVEQAP